MHQSSNHGTKISCAECTLHEVCIPKHINPAELHEFENIVKRSRILHKGDYMHHYGDPVKSLYIIRSGSVKEYVTSNEGNEQIVGFYLPGELLGLDSIGKERYSCSATSLETTTYCALPLTKFEKICQQIPDLQKMMLNTMSKVISFDNKMLLSSCNKKAHEKIATFLMSLSKRYLRLGYSAKEMHLPMSRQEIANYLGLSSETVSRVFTRLQKDNIIAVHPKMITIKDMDYLKELSQSCSTHKITVHHIA